MPGANPVDQCVQDLKAKIVASAADAIENRTLYVYDQEDLLDLKKVITPPFVGVVYVGLREVGAQGGGQGTELVCDIYLMAAKCSAKVPNQTVSTSTTLLLDQIRNAIKCTKSPCGHYWQFVFEAPVDLRDEVMYVQRWRTRVMLTS